MKPSYEELEQKLVNTERKLLETEKKLAETQDLLKKAFLVIRELEAKVTKLEEQINKNSNNSSKPPSTDQKANTPPKPPKKRGNRKGIARASFSPERIDEHIACTQESCPHCGSSAIRVQEAFSQRLQQVELPEIQAIVREYVLQKYKCLSCGKHSRAELPKGVPNSSFGPKLMGLFATLTGVFHLSRRESIQLLKDLCDIDISLGSTSNIEERASAALYETYHRIQKFVIESSFCKHFDETGWRDAGKRHYVWLASCKPAAFYKIHRHRNKEAFLDLVGEKLGDFAAVTDRYALYNAIGKDHQYCLAHLIRDFRKYAERAGPDKEIGASLERVLITVCKTHKKYREGEKSLSWRNRSLAHAKRYLEKQLEEGFAHGSDELHKLSGSLLESYDKLWTFTRIKGMEPTNNLAERDLRKMVIWRKTSHGTKSGRGKTFAERIMSISETAKRQGRNVLHYIQEAITSFFKGESAPFIAPSMGF